MRRILVCLFLSFSAAACAQAEETVTAVPLENSTSASPATLPSPPSTAASIENPNQAAREHMVESGVVAAGITDPAVIEAMGNVPRHQFVPPEFQDQAYDNHPLPIGFGQTISQPYIVALMTEAAEIEEDDVVLEVGTGSGYQAAVLAEIVDQVYTMEIIEDLAVRAENDLEEAGYDNITVRHADGYFGWEENAPYDAIIVTAAPDHVPQPLLLQLKIGGNLIIPVGPVGGVQTLWRITRESERELSNTNLGSVSFVPFTRMEETE